MYRKLLICVVALFVLAAFFIPLGQAEDSDPSWTDTPESTPTETHTPTPTATEIPVLIMMVSHFGTIGANCVDSPCRYIWEAVNLAPTGQPVEIRVAGDTNNLNNVHYAKHCSGSIFCVDGKDIRLRCGFHPTTWVQYVWNWMPVYLDPKYNGRVAMVSNGGSLSVENCRLTQGNVVGNGGLFHVTDGSLLITDLYADGGEAEYGGAVYAENSTIVFQRSAINWMTARQSGGMIYAVNSDVLIVNSALSGPGTRIENGVAGVHLVNSTAEILHTAFRSSQGPFGNQGPPWLGSHIGAYSSTVGITNTSLSLAEVGIVSVDSNVYGSNNNFWNLSVADTSGSVALANSVSHSPMISSFGTLNPASELRDKGINTWVIDDIHGDPRGGLGDPPDIGPDEILPDETDTPTPTPTLTPTLTITPTEILTTTATSTQTSTPTQTPTTTVTSTPTSTLTPTMTSTPTPTHTATRTPTATSAVVLPFLYYVYLPVAGQIP